MKRIFTLIASLTIIMLGFAVPASATGGPPAPEAVPEVCTGPGTFEPGGIIIPESEKYKYDIHGDGGFDPLEAGFHELPAGDYDVRAYKGIQRKGQWDLTVDDAGDCLVPVTPEDPIFEHPVCVDEETTEPGSAAIPEQEGVTYDPAEDQELAHGEDITVVASIDEGYELDPEDADTEWSFLAVVVPCDGTDGEDGSDGSDGEDGEDGKTPILDDVTPAASTGKTLPETGAGTLALVGGSALLLMLGSALVLIGRKRLAQR